MQSQGSLRLHHAALKQDQVRFNVLVSTLDRVIDGSLPNLRFWSLGDPGACAAQAPGRPLVLGELNSVESARLAEMTCDLDYTVVTGPEQAASSFVRRATELGLLFGEVMPQAIHALSHAPTYPVVDGSGRFALASENDLLAEWITAFSVEALPDEKPPASHQLRELAASKRYVIWEVDGRPVSMAGISRRTESTMSISAVYTPPDLRCRGYAGASVAYLVELAFAEGKHSVCLYTDLRNPYSNRCYRKIGFTPICRTGYHVRLSS
jgi:GNAT superfamily N-acetyltransferase